MKEINTKKLLKIMKKEIDSFSDALWHSELGDTSELENIISNNFIKTTPDFDEVNTAILTYIKILNEDMSIQQETVQYQTYETHSDKEDLYSSVAFEDSQYFGCYEYYLGQRSFQVFEELSFIVTGVLEHFYKVEVLYKRKTKSLLNNLKNDVLRCDGWYWHNELEGLKKLEETLNKWFWIEDVDFKFLSYEILKFLEIIDAEGNIQTNTIQIRANILSDEEEFKNHGKDSGFNSFEEYLTRKTDDAFWEVQETMVKSLFAFHYTHFKGEK